jgi:hypothetical protein
VYGSAKGDTYIRNPVPIKLMMIPILNRTEGQANQRLGRVPKVLVRRTGKGDETADEEEDRS